jgi:hypothetical protein
VGCCSLEKDWHDGGGYVNDLSKSGMMNIANASIAKSELDIIFGS